MCTSGRGEREKYVIGGRVIGREMKKYWRELFIGFLVLFLVVVTASSTVTYNRYVALQEQSVKTEQSLVKQTQLVVELRKKLVPKDFDNLDDLKQWVSNWEIENKPIAITVLNKTFVLAGNDELYSRYWDCDDLAEAMQRDALRDGYLVSTCLVDGRGMVYERKVSNQEWHTGCMTMVGNIFYFIEPLTGGIVLIIERD